MLEALAGLDEVVVCLYDGDYHYGVAALANSLAKSGFKGFINTAYRGYLPPWVNQLKGINSHTFYVNDSIIIHFEKVHTDMHLAYFKPFFIKQTFDNFPSVTKIFYFDVDIVVSAPWSFFSNWLEDHVCLCLDNSFDYVHHNHPWRKDWKRLAKVDQSFCNPVTAYVNSGFIGIKRKNAPLLNKWKELTENFKEKGGDLKKIYQNGKSSYKGDQDLLNAAITVCPEVELSLIGKEGMGFTQPAYLMSHAIAKVKPWKKNFLKYLIEKGHKPSYSEKDFFQYCKYPIKLFSGSIFFIKKANLILATFFGRYIGY